MKLQHHTAGFLAIAALAGLVVLTPLHTAAAQAATLDDPTIIAIFDAANTWDMETGALAAKKGTTKEIREFGAMLERDHGVVRQQGRDLAKKLGVSGRSKMKKNELVDAIHGARGRCAAIVINPGAFTHYAWAIHDALATFPGPVVEVVPALPLLVGRLPARVVRVIALVLLFVRIGTLGGAAGVRALSLFGLLRVLVPLFLTTTVLLIGHDVGPRVGAALGRRSSRDSFPS